MNVSDRPARSWPTRWKGLIIPALLLVVCLASAGVGQYVQRRVDIVTRRDNTVMVDLERLMSLLKDVETGQRGFLILGDESYLEPYHDALARIGPLLDSLASTGFDLDDLPSLVNERVRMATAGIVARRQGGLDAGVRALSTGQGKAVMDRARMHVASLQARAQARLDKARHRGDVWLDSTTAIAVLTLAAAVLLVIVSAGRRRSEQRAVAALLDAVLDNAPVGLGLLDRSLRVRHINRALAAIGDRALGVDVGRSIWDVMPQLRATFEDRLRDVVEGGLVLPNTDVTAGSTENPGQLREFQVSFYPLDTDRVAPGGARGDARGGARGGSRGRAVEGAGGGAGMVVTDVTVRNRLERRLRESEERFRTLAESSAAILWTATPDGVLDLGKPEWARFSGVPEAELGGLGWVGTVQEADRAATLAAWRHAIETGARYAVEQRVRRADGAWRTMEVLAVPVRNADGTMREWVGTHVDITERREAEDALAAARDEAEAANRAKSTFLANMSHELRTPLTAVIGYSEMLEEELEEIDQPELVRDLGKIESNARHLLSLINDVLDLSKIEANRMTTYAEEADVASLINEAAETVQSLITRKNNTLDVRLAADPPLGLMHTDVVKVRQCLFNLISNAAKFTEAGRITLSAERWVRDGADWLRFRVADTGIGMTEDQLARLFQRFAQADESTTRQFGGTGLGLALTRAFCRLLGGDVSVESTHGAGTTFTMELPAVLPDPAADAQGGDAKSGDAKSGDAKGGENAGVLVLVVDDDAAQRDLLSRFLERQGFTVRTAADGRAGLAMARDLHPRAILLDIMMPQMDGWSVLGAIKADPALAGIPVVMASFVNEPAMAAALGASDYLLKPLDWDRLRDVMERFRNAEGAVLVVDDNHDVRTQARTVLERHGWTVAEARNGAEALEMVDRAMPQMILLDLTMPVMDGFQFLHELRGRPGGADVPVLVLSARDLSAADRERLRDADRILRKGELDLRHLPDELTDIAQAHASPAA